ncbi:MAG TPA: BatD family protein [Thermoanaerobaculia bacterium]
MKDLVKARPCFLLLALLGVLAAPAMAEIDARVRLHPEVIGVGEIATLTVEVRSDEFSSLIFRPDFELENLEIVTPRSQYEDLRYTNGALLHSVRQVWQVRALEPGRARVRSISVRLQDRVIPVPDQEIQVQRDPARLGLSQRSIQRQEDPFERFFGRMPLPWRRESQQPPVFLRAEMEPARPVVGQQVVYTIYLYTRENIGAISPSGVPDFRGFWVRDIPIPQQLNAELVEIEGRRYGRVPLIRKALFPLRPGRYQIEPAVVDVTVQTYSRSVFFAPRSEPMRLRTEPASVDVRPLPPAPPGFAGAVGQIAMAVQVEPREVRLGEAATLTVRVGGTGNLQGLHEPALDLPPGLTAFPPQQEGADDVTGSRVRGTRIWHYSVIPERAGRYTLEPPRIAYFDPAAGEYKVATAPDLVLTALPRPVSKDESATSGEPHGIRFSAADMAGGAGRRWTRTLPWLFAIPWALALVVTLARRRGSGSSPMGPLRPLGAAPAAGAPALARMEETLREVESEQRPRQVAARLEEAWRELLAERWDIPPATSSSRWREMLAARGVTLEALDELGRLLEDLSYLRYAPQLSSTDNLRAETLARCRLLLRRLK